MERKQKVAFMSEELFWIKRASELCGKKLVCKYTVGFKAEYHGRDNGVLLAQV